MYVLTYLIECRSRLGVTCNNKLCEGSAARGVVSKTCICQSAQPRVGVIDECDTCRKGCINTKRYNVKHITGIPILVPDNGP